MGSRVGSTCPNTKCDFHKDPPPTKYAFVISVVEEGMMGKNFKVIFAKNKKCNFSLAFR